MTQYNFTQSNEPGSQYHRAKKVVLNNPKIGIKSVTFSLECITYTANGDFVSTDAGIIVSNAPTTDEEFDLEIELIDIEGEKHGVIKRGKMMELLMLYLNSELNAQYAQELNKAVRI